MRILRLLWNMAADRREHDAIEKMAKSCPDAKLNVAHAKVTP